MRTKGKAYSIIRRITLMSSVAYLFLILLLVVNNLYMIRVLRRTVYDSAYGMLVQKNKEISTALRGAENYLVSLSINSADLSEVSLNDNSSEYYISMQRLRQNLESTLVTMPDVEGLFVFPLRTGMMIYTTADTQAAEAFRNKLREADMQTLQSISAKGWEPVFLKEKMYLFYFIRRGDICLGAWTSTGNVLARAREASTLAENALFIYADGTYDDDLGSRTEEAFATRSYTFTDTVRYAGFSYLPVISETEFCDTGALCLLIPTARFTSAMMPNYVLLLAFTVIFILFGLVAVHLTRRNLSRPLNQLNESMMALQAGDFSVRVPVSQTSSELSQVDHTFNQMAERISDLKIQVYEEKLRQQKTELLALKNQIAPHFLINSMNAMYHMAGAGKTEGIQQMAVTLSEHLRYALSDASTVQLSDEVEKVKNYVTLSSIRFPGSIELILDIEEDALRLSVPPMILLFQVENIVKYEVINGEVTEIHIEVVQDYLDGQDCTHFSIWDTGSGYATDVLNQLSSPEMLSQSDGHNIGTRNILQRLHLLFGDRIKMTFANRKNAGAQVDIWLPMTAQGEQA